MKEIIAMLIVLIVMANGAAYAASKGKELDFVSIALKAMEVK
jgi:uncharacterized protein YxeA